MNSTSKSEEKSKVNEINKSNLDKQKRKIRRKFISGLTVLILGIIFLILAGYLWRHYIAYGYMMGGMSGLILYGAVGLTIWSIILMIPGLIQLISYRKIRKEQNKKFNDLSMEETQLNTNQPKI
ncbi:MAG: hypothetical protein ACFE9N_13615 [Promethearchaeota archaeon]